MTAATASEADTMNRALEAMCMLLMPFFMLGAGDDPEKARSAVADLIQAYSPGTTQQLDLAARVIGFSAAALDNLRLSMTSPTLSDTKVLRYRSAAVSLSRSAEQCRVVLQQLQAEQLNTTPPTEAGRTATPSPQPPIPQMTIGQIEKAKGDARTLLAGLAKASQAVAPEQGLSALRIMPDEAAAITASVKAAIAAHRAAGA